MSYPLIIFWYVLYETLTDPNTIYICFNDQRREKNGKARMIATRIRMNELVEITLHWVDTFWLIDYWKCVYYSESLTYSADALTNTFLSPITFSSFSKFWPFSIEMTFPFAFYPSCLNFYRIIYLSDKTNWMSLYTRWSDRNVTLRVAYIRNGQMT